MSTSIFRGKTATEAHEAAVAELGRDAIVVATRRVKRGGIYGFLGQTEIEVAAAPAPSTAQESRLLEKKRPFAAGAYDRTTPPPADVDAITTAVRAELRTELRSLRAAAARPSSIEEEIASIHRAIEAAIPMPKGRDQIAKVLARLGIEGTPARNLARAAKALTGIDGETAVQQALADGLEVTQWPIGRGERGVIAVVGPTGVGKTTTIAKLAGRAVLEENATVTLVAADVWRVGAVEQLGRFATLLGAKLEVATTEQDLRRILANATTDLVFVDTAGRGPIGESGVERALGDKPMVAGRRRHVLLCATAAVRAADAQVFARTFAPAHPTAIVITKLDECSAPAGIVHTALATKLPIAAVAFGYRVPEDIAQATKGGVLERVLGAPARSLG